MEFNESRDAAGGPARAVGHPGGRPGGITRAARAPLRRVAAARDPFIASTTRVLRSVSAPRAAPSCCAGAIAFQQHARQRQTIDCRARASAMLSPLRTRPSAPAASGCCAEWRMRRGRRATGEQSAPRRKRHRFTTAPDARRVRSSPSTATPVQRQLRALTGVHPNSRQMKHARAKARANGASNSSPSTVTR